MKPLSCHSKRCEGTRSAETLHGVYPEAKGEPLRYAQGLQLRRRIQDGRKQSYTRSDFWHLSTAEKIYRFAEILRFADSVQDNEGKIIHCIRNQTRGTVLCARATLAHGFRGRTRGLLGRHQLSPDEGMLFEAEPVPLMWMHTFFMTFPIDIVFLGRGDVVIKIQSSLQPWRLSAIVPGAHKAIELADGAAATTDTEVGDLILFAEVHNSIKPSLYIC